MATPKVDDGTVLIHGRAYLTVAKRIADFRSVYPDYRIDTTIVHIDEDNCVVKATISDPTGAQLSSGIAHEVKGATNINRTSHVENAETSAVGRALAFFGMGGTEIASADEVANAINQQKQQEAEADFITYMEKVREHITSIDAIKTNLALGDYDMAAEAESEIPRDDLVVLWRAPSKGGIWATGERALLKSDEMNQARKQHATNNTGE